MFTRPVTANEKLYLSAKPFFGDAVIQLVIEGYGSLRTERLEQAVKQVSLYVPGARLRLYQNQWIADGQTPQVIKLIQHPFDQGDESESICSFNHFNPEQGVTCEVALFSSPQASCLIFRALHAVMDGHGLRVWAQSVFQALQGKALFNTASEECDDTFLKRQKARIRIAEPILPLCLGPKSTAKQLSDNRFHIARRTLDSCFPSIVAKLAMGAKELLVSSPKDRSLVMIPVDLRKAFPHLNQLNTANMTLPLIMDIKGQNHWTDLNSDMLKQLDENRFVARGRNDSLYRHIPSPWLGNVLRLMWRYQLQRGSYMFSAIISHMGRFTLNDFHAPEFQAQAIFCIPNVSPVAPLSVTIAETERNTEICVMKNVSLWDSAESLLNRLMSCTPIESPIRISSQNPTRKSLTSTAGISLLQNEHKAEYKRAYAEAHGPKLPSVPKAQSTLGALLERAATQFGDHCIGYLNEFGEAERETYRDLYVRASRIAAGLALQNLDPKARVLLQCQSPQAFLGAFWGCVATGAVPVPLAVEVIYDESAINRLQAAHQLTGSDLLITNQDIQQTLLKKCDQAWLKIVSTEQLEATPQQTWHRPKIDDIALMMLTSGTTGAAKAVTLTHRNLTAQAFATQLATDMSVDEVTLNWMPFDHVAALVLSHIRDVFLGCSQFHASTTKILEQPLRWIDWMHRHKVTVSFAPNFAFALVNELEAAIATQFWDLKAVRYLFNGGEAVVGTTARRFLSLLKTHGLNPTVMIPIWGMSETSSAAVISRDFNKSFTSEDSALTRMDTDSVPVDVGQPLPGISLRIVDETGALLKNGEVGQLETRGEAVTRGYYNNDVMNGIAFSQDGWFKTGDLAYIKAGCLTLTGRQKDVIVIRGLNYSCHSIEQLAEKVVGLSKSHTAACAVRPKGAQTDQVALFFNTTASDEQLVKILKALQQKLTQQIGISAQHLIPLEKSQFPRTQIGKIQRSVLKERFESGAFESILNDVSQLMANFSSSSKQRISTEFDQWDSEHLPPWFHRPIWVRQHSAEAFSKAEATKAKHAQLPDTEMLSDESVILFHCETPFGEIVQAELARRGLTVLTVKPGERFQQINSKEFRLDPAEPNHYRCLLEEIADVDGQRLPLITLWPYESISRQMCADTESYGSQQFLTTNPLLYLIQTIAKEQDEYLARSLMVVGCSIYSTGQEKPFISDSRLIPGLLRTATREIPGFVSRMIDLDGECSAATAAIAVANELLAQRNEPEVVFRGSGRYVRRFQSVQLSSPPTGLLPLSPRRQTDAIKDPFRVGGCYLITGGLGGIGSLVARYLLEEYQARLLLVGRFGSTKETATAEAGVRGQRLTELKSLGGEVTFQTVDVCDEKALLQVVKKAEQAWSAPLDGVLHLAGELPQRTLVDLTPSELATTSRVKTDGGWALANLVKVRPKAFLVNFSSVNALFGGYGTAAYAAANCYLEGLTDYISESYGIATYCFAWSLWDETGMSQDYSLKEAVGKSGFHVMNPELALLSFFEAMRMGCRQMVIGMDISHPYIQSLLVPKHLSKNSLMQHDCDELQSPSFSHVNESPNIEVSIAHLNQTSDIKQLVISVWTQLLDIEEIDCDESFFELGANSLIMVQARRILKVALSREVDHSTLYDYPTVNSLSNFLVAQV